MKKDIVIDIICFLFILLFMYAAITKLWDYEKFRVQIGQSPLLTPFTRWIAWGVPSIEIIISLLLAITRFRIVGLYASFTLMVIFTAYIISILNFSMYVPCSCGGILEKLGWEEHLIFNCAFVLLALAGVIVQHKLEPKEPAMA